MGRFTTWRKSGRSDGGDNCVEIANGDTEVGVRDSKDQAGPVLIFGAKAWGEFVAGIGGIHPAD